MHLILQLVFSRSAIDNLKLKKNVNCSIKMFILVSHLHDLAQNRHLQGGYKELKGSSFTTVTGSRRK